MVFPKGVRQAGIFTVLECGKLAFHQRLQIVPEISQEQFVVLRSQQYQNVVVVFADMLKQMQKHRVCAVALEYMLMSVFFVVFCVEYMAEQFFTKGFQKIILCFKMGIESGSADVRVGNDLANGYLTKIFLGE